MSGGGGDCFGDSNPTIPAHIVRLRNVINDNCIGCDIKWVLFTTAAVSWRYKTCLKPYPMNYCSEGDIDISSLIGDIHKLPNFATLVNKLNMNDLEGISKLALRLLYWVLIIQEDPILIEKPNSILKQFIPQLVGEDDKRMPLCLLKVMSTRESERERFFRMRSAAGRHRIGFFTTKLDSLYSILHDSYNFSPNENLRLESDFDICLQRAQSCSGWGGSALGGTVRWIGICEIIMDFDHVRLIEDYEYPARKQILLRNREFMRIRYLMFYHCDEPHIEPNFPLREESPLDSPLTFICSMLGFSIMIASIVCANNDTIVNIREMVIEALQKYASAVIDALQFK